MAAPDTQEILRQLDEDIASMKPDWKRDGVIARVAELRVAIAEVVLQERGARVLEVQNPGHEERLRIDREDAADRELTRQGRWQTHQAREGAIRKRHLGPALASLTLAAGSAEIGLYYVACGALVIAGWAAWQGLSMVARHRKAMEPPKE